MASGYRIHPVGESVETLLSDRRDGWTCDAETGTELSGVSCCSTLVQLRRYVVHYGMAVQAGDRLIYVTGNAGDEATDIGEIRIVADDVTDLGDAAEFLAAAADLATERTPRESELEALVWEE